MNAALAHATLTISATLFDSLWEGVLIVGIVALCLRLLPKLGAATRYAIWLGVLAALVLIPVLTVLMPRLQLAPVMSRVAPAMDGVPPGASTALSMAPLTPLARPRSDTARRSPNAATADPMNSSPARVAQLRANPAGVARLRRSSGAVARRKRNRAAMTATTSTLRGSHRTARITLAVSPRTARITIPQNFAAAAALLWILLACWRGLLLYFNLRDLTAVRRNTTLWSSAHGYPVLRSDRVQVPLAVGLLRPAIILPATLVEQLSPDAVATVVLHEVAHLRRYDVWTNAVARIVGAFVAFNPAASFVVRRLSMEREIACDDWVVARLGAGDVLARALATMATRVTCRAPLAAPSAIGSRHSIVVRIERLLDSRPRHLRLSLSALGGAFMLLTLIAFLMQSVSPVLAYETGPNGQSQGASVQIAGTCPVPERGIRMRTPFGAMWYDPANPNKIVSWFGAAHVATVDVTVDADGKPRQVAVLSAPPYPGMVKHVRRIFMTSTYEPALHNCRPVTATMRTGARFGSVHGNALSIVAPAYPRGWSARYKSACKVPSLIHTGVPAFPKSMRTISVDKSYSASARVHVDAAGVATSAVTVMASGQRAFDDALLAVARRERYPLTESTGFKPVRPDNAPLAWNAAHGSNVYSKCTPLPTDYIWSTTFQQIVPMGLPGSTRDILVEGFL